MAEAQKKTMNKTMEAENIALLKHLLDMELRRAKEESDMDILMFIGMDGRIFATEMPLLLEAEQFRLLNMIKRNLHHICLQLSGEDLTVSIEVFKKGAMLITAVGDNAFLASLTAKETTIPEVSEKVSNLKKTSAVLKHIFHQGAMTEEALSELDPEVGEELKKLSRQLFVEQFKESRGYKQNREIYDFIKKRVSSVVGVGAVDEIMTLTFNKLGTSMAYMKDDMWMKFLEAVIEDHIKLSGGDIVVEECRRTWVPELERKMKSFL